MYDYVTNPITVYATEVPILDGPDDWEPWRVYIKSVALQNEVWKYIDPWDETITREKPVEPTRPVATKDVADMDQDEELAWEMELLEYNRLKRIYDEDFDGLSRVRLAILNTVSQNHPFYHRKSISVRRLIIKLQERIGSMLAW
ncbi:hypothetical protein CNMCM6106_006059 [Aspergillus hiratsukae]|uniref:Uncharacterized protein n=1 Tax=Aspergillus hiratsukae TaxID=1194566 RepID=A0A8H6V190_9EURO|nr:hypothetical protein CNMCM6106_006059 [Aspergillus hiratsukae]